MTQLLAHLFGDYVLQNHWMALNKTQRWWPAIVHATLYMLPFLIVFVNGAAIYERWQDTSRDSQIVFKFEQDPDDPFHSTTWRTIYPPTKWERTWDVIRPYCLPFFLMWSTHLLIDRFRLARLWTEWYGVGCSGTLWRRRYLATPVTRILQVTPTDPNPNWVEAPDWLKTWLLIIVDNTIHLTVNCVCLSWLASTL